MRCAPERGGVSVLWAANMIYVHESANGDWCKWVGAGSLNVGPAQQGGTVRYHSLQARHP